MNARLVENWLDSASERSYQAPFCQILLAKGYRVLHSSRHGSIELGKDVIAIDQGGTPWAFQLKGNPGTRLTLAQFREIEAQLHELVVYPLAGPGIPAAQHRAVLVTNGLVEEEVRLAIERMNAAYQLQGLRGRLEVLQRGDLLADALEIGEALWPSELQDVHTLLEILVTDGRSMYPTTHAHRLLSQLLLLKQAEETRLGGAELRRRITSASLLIAISLQPFERRENHFAAVTAWTMFATYALAATLRHNRSFAESAGPAVAVAEGAILDSLVALAIEVLASETLAEGNLLVDSIAHGARYLLLLSLLSSLWFWCRTQGWPKSLDKSAVEEFLKNRRHMVDLWGEGAIPQALTYYWFLRANEASVYVEDFLIGLVTSILSRVRQKGEGLPSPYFDFEEVSRHRLAGVLTGRSDPLKQEAIGSRSYFVEALLHLLVRTNRKQACRSLWPAISEMTFSSYVPAFPWSYCLWHTDDGTPTEVIPPLTKKWADLVHEARRIECPEAPSELRNRTLLNMLFLVLRPYRATPNAVRHLGHKLDDTWMIAPPIP